jgi:hypothetical protein
MAEKRTKRARADNRTEKTEKVAIDSLRLDVFDQVEDVKKKNLRLKTNNKSTGEAQSANYLKSRTDYTSQCQIGNAKQETTNSIVHININTVTDPQKLHARTLTK